MDKRLQDIRESVLLYAIQEVYKHTPAQGSRYTEFWQELFLVVFGENPKDSTDERWDILFKDSFPLLRRYEGRPNPDEKKKIKLQQKAAE